MIGPFTALENFIFKAFNMFGRASRAEYFWVMLVYWGAMIGLAYLDALVVWDRIMAFSLPPLNPLAYGTVYLFVITLIPRVTLSVRRLHDAGRAAIWAVLPYCGFVIGFWVVFGALAALFVGIANGQLAFPAGTTLFQAFMSMFDTPGQLADGTRVLMVLGMPLLVPALYLLLMAWPSARGENGFGRPVRSNAIKGTGKAAEHNPFAAYAILACQDDGGPTEAQRVANKQEVHSLYRQRVLGLSD
ncbi:DUF805 domain-containing protein [Aestuariibius sp. HNIBRBA575]|uniref:DUF805 domain-containing protein n=1 Tax=Aestuariibius sp. HNIBRBA575 TaxID=3233343 RepID=UPI0034A2BCDF